MERSIRALARFAQAAILLPALAQAQTAVPTLSDSQCYAGLQGKVAWDKAGSMNWEQDNMRKLCEGTTTPAATIACFQAQISSHGDWSQGIAACKTGGPAAPPPNQVLKCIYGVEGKVAWDKAGSTQWSPNMTRSLCGRTTNADVTIACFKSEIAIHGEFGRAASGCSTGQARVILPDAPARGDAGTAVANAGRAIAKGIAEWIEGAQPSPGSRSITFSNQAGYVAKVVVVYHVAQTMNGVTIPAPKVIESPQIPAGFSRTLEIPRNLMSGMPISLKIEGIGTMKQTGFAATIPEAFTGNRCFKAWGTIFDAHGGACQ